MAQSANCWDVRLLWGFDRNRLVMSDGWKVSTSSTPLLTNSSHRISCRRRHLLQSSTSIDPFYVLFWMNDLVIKGAETQNFATKIGAHKGDQGRSPIIAQMLVQIWVVRISLYMYCCFSMIDNLKSSFNLKFFMHYY